MIDFYDNPEDFKNNKIMCNAWVAAAIIGGSALSAGASIFGSSQASKAQQQAAQNAANTSREMFDKTSAFLAPYMDVGSNAIKQLENNNYYTAPINLTQDWLESTPGYQFTKTQGLKSVQNSAAARGLGVSGAALKGAANFATGLADNTYKTQFDVANTNQTNAYNRLKSLVDVGENAAAKTGVAALGAGGQIGAAQIGAGNAQAANWNNVGSQIGNFANNVGGYYAYKGLYGGGNDNYDTTNGNQALWDAQAASTRSS